MIRSGLPEMVTVAPSRRNEFWASVWTMRPLSLKVMRVSARSAVWSMSHWTLSMSDGWRSQP